MIIFHDVAQGSPEWHALRKDRWTGSKAIRLLQGKPMPRDTEFGGNIYTRRGHALEAVAILEYERQVGRRGHALEAVAILEYERQVGRRVMRPGFVTNSVYQNAGYSPDGIEGRTLLEVKALNGERHDKLAAGDIPLEFLVQIYFGMIITGLRKAKLLAFNPECEQQLTVMEVTYDKIIGTNIRNKLKLDMKRRQAI